MPRQLNKLSSVTIKNLKKPGRYSDGGGLYLFVKKSGERSWVFRYRSRITQKLRDMGLGPEREVRLKEARENAAHCRSMLRDGIDPLDHRKEARINAMLEKAREVTFKECADNYIGAHRERWQNDKHIYQWERTLEVYAATLMPLPVSSVDTTLVLQCLEPIWLNKTETATRVRQRIESVLDWATARNYRVGENPARWRGHLDKLLAKPSELKAVQHQPALDYREIGSFMTKLRQKNGLAACALELQILTATRPGEVVGARWDEFNLTNATITIVDRNNRTRLIKVDGLWTIPEERMKANKAHEIPLTKQAVRLLKSLPKVSEFVFPSIKQGKHLTTQAGMNCLKSLHPGITAHGFRSTFREWAADHSHYPREVAEHALAHQLKDKAEAAYHRKTMLPKRSKLMQSWADYCDIEAQPAATVTPIRGSKGV